VVTKPKIETVTARADDSQFSVDDINARRLRGERHHDNTVPLRDPGKWALRWVNSMAEANRHYTIVHQDGWIPATVAHLADGVRPESIGASISLEGHVVRGPNGDERLYLKDKALHDAIKLAETDKRMKPMRSERAAREDVANATAAAHGSEAADYIHKNTSITIRDTQGPVA
jgi:hypothetical protein